MPAKIVIPTYIPNEFDIDQETEWKSHLNTKGFVVIRNAITEEHAKIMMDYLRKDLHIISPKFKWDDKTTWVSENLPLVMGKGSLVFNGIGQSDTVWHARINSLMMYAFSLIYGTDKLAVAMDGLSLFISDKQNSTPWLHQDQRKSDTRLSIQGVLNLLPCGEKDAGFICVPRSHVEYKEQPNTNIDWVMLPENSPYYGRAVKIATSARSTILFHSKLIHANTGMTKKHPQGLHINRISAYITFVPKSRQSEEIYKKRIDGYYKGDTTSHWADRHEPKSPPIHIKKKIDGFGFIQPTLNEDGSIPADRMALI